MHLTNYSLNKDEGKFKVADNANDDSGHKRSLQTVLNRLKQEGQDVDKLMGEIKDMIVKTIISAQKDLAHSYHYCQPLDLEGLMCFQLLGFDVILDKNCKPFLLEVNQSPSFKDDSPVDYEVKRNLMRDTFNLLGINPEKKKQKMIELHAERRLRTVSGLSQQ